MKQRTNSSRQKQLLFAGIATMVFMFAANSLAFAQAGYKVGDKIEVQGNAEWFKAEVLEVKGDSYKIAFDGYGSAYHEWVKTDRMRPIAANRQTDNQNAATNQAQNQTNKNNQTDTPTAAQPAQTTKLNKYGARDPRTCNDTIAPRRGAITAALAKQYFICQAEADYFQTNFIDITTAQRSDGNLDEFLAADKLHPSAKEYYKWAKMLTSHVINVFEGTSQ